LLRGLVVARWKNPRFGYARARYSQIS